VHSFVVVDDVDDSVLCTFCLPSIFIGLILVRYGTDDGGRTLQWTEKAHKIASDIGKKLNVRPHQVVGKEIALCGDFEIHEANAHYYALGTYGTEEKKIT
jgi:hypothetical protein